MLHKRECGVTTQRALLDLEFVDALIDVAMLFTQSKECVGVDPILDGSEQRVICLVQRGSEPRWNVQSFYVELRKVDAGDLARRGL